MSEVQPKESDFQTPRELYTHLYDQVHAVAEAYQGKTLFREQGNAEEYLYTLSSLGACSMVFETKQLNISMLDDPEGAYDNTFKFSFTQDSFQLIYTEAMPRREQAIEVTVDEFTDLQAFQDAALPFFEKINVLLEYFHLPTRIQY